MLYMASRFNHECIPSVESKIDSDGNYQAVLQRDVEAEEELTVTYIWDIERFSVKKRRAELKKWGFRCVCSACVAGAIVAGDNIVEADESDLTAEVRNVGV